MKWLRRIAFGLAAATTVVALVGLLLPRKVRLERSATIAAPRATVFTLVNTFRGFNRWSPWYPLDPDAEYELSGPAFGPGAKIAWVGDPRKVGSGSQEIVESVPFERVKNRLQLGPGQLAETEMALAAEGKATRATWSFATDLGWNPFGRYLGLLLDRFVGRDFEKGLAGLDKVARTLPQEDFAGLTIELVDLPARTLAVASLAVDSPVQVRELKAGRALRAVVPLATTDLVAVEAQLRACAAARMDEPAGAAWREVPTPAGEVAVFLPIE